MLSYSRACSLTAHYALQQERLKILDKAEATMRLRRLFLEHLLKSHCRNLLKELDRLSENDQVMPILEAHATMCLKLDRLISELEVIDID